MHWFVCNDARREVKGVNLGGSAIRDGRFFFYGKRNKLLTADWSFFSSLNWLELCLRFGGEDSLIRLSLILPRLAYLGVGVGVPRGWLAPWMIEDRVFRIDFGYVNTIMRLYFAWAEWAEDCGMTDYYRRQVPRKHTALQLWPGWQFALRFPPLLTWIFGREEREKRILDTKPVSFEMDGRKYEGTWTLELWESTRTRWPWSYKRSVSSNLEVPNPPMFAGKGENSWDCGDDAIYGMGSREITPAKTVGDYIKRVLEYRERYGAASDAR